MTIPKWLQEKTPQEKGRRFEKKFAKKIGGRVQPASGALPIAKEDIVTPEFLIQAKLTTKKQYILKLSDLETLRTNAIKMGKVPMMTLVIGMRSWQITPISTNVQKW